MEDDLYKNMYNLFSTNDAKHRSGLRLHISDLVNICPRAVWFARKTGKNFRFKRTYPKPMVLAFTYGILIQNLLAKYSSYLISKWKCFQCGETHYLSYGKSLKCNRKNMKLEEYYLNLSRGWFTLTGSVDALIRVGKQVFIAEIKSIRPEDFDSLEEPLFDHIFQTCGYLWMYNNKFVKKDPAFELFHVSNEKAYIIYFKKDFKKIAIKPYLVDKKEYNLHHRIPELLKQIVSKEIPERTCRTKLSPNAKKCMFREECFNEPKTKQSKRKRTSEKSG